MFAKLAEQPRRFLVGVLQGHQGRAAPFAADGEALHHAQKDEHYGGEPADGGVPLVATS
jgi:hypothetical protein